MKNKKQFREMKKKYGNHKHTPDCFTKQCLIDETPVKTKNVKKVGKYSTQCDDKTHYTPTGDRDAVMSVCDCKPEHTEDCLDANDDTSVLKGKCICPKPQHTPPPWEFSKRSKEDFRVAIRQIGNTSILAESLSEANAAYIVEAVNQHSELKKTEQAYGEGCLHRKELLAANTKLKECHEELLTVCKQVLTEIVNNVMNRKFDISQEWFIKQVAKNNKALWDAIQKAEGR